MPAQVHPFTYYRERWDQALQRIPHLEGQARRAAVEHVRGQVHAAARREGLSVASVGVYWQGGPQLHIEDGPTADAEYGTLSTSPRAVLRNTARRAHPQAAAIYHHRIWTGLGL